jgi:hypothetical protein
LEGLLQLVVGIQLKEADAPFADLRNLLLKYEELIPDASTSDRLPLIATYYIFNALVRPEDRVENAGTFEKPYLATLNPPSLEGLAVRFALGRDAEWTADELAELHATYYRRKYKPNRLQLPPIYEAALSLSLAEAFRRSGNLSEATACIETARDNLPAMKVLLGLDAQLSDTPDLPVSWTKILLPATEDGAEEKPPQSEWS